MLNPFEIIDKRLENIESILINLRSEKPKPVEVAPTFNKIPILEIFNKKMLSKPTLYAHVKAGNINLYKLGGRSYVDASEFENVFKKVIIKK